MAASDYPPITDAEKATMERLLIEGVDQVRLYDALEAVLKLADKGEHGATRWADPLPVPVWVHAVRRAVAGPLGALRNDEVRRG